MSHIFKNGSIKEIGILTDWIDIGSNINYQVIEYEDYYDVTVITRTPRDSDGDGSALANIPNPYRPSKEIRFAVGYDMPYSKAGFGKICSNGDIYIYNQSGYSTNCFSNFSYKVKKS